MRWSSYPEVTVGDAVEHRGNLVRDISIPVTCKISGYKIFDFAKLMRWRMSRNSYFEPILSGGLGYNPYSSLGPFALSTYDGYEGETPSSQYTTYQTTDGYGNDTFNRFVAYSMKINISKVVQDFTNDGSDGTGATITSLASGVSYSDSTADWVIWSTPVSLTAGDVIRVEADTTYNEIDTNGDYGGAGTGRTFNPEPGLVWEWGNHGNLSDGSSDTFSAKYGEGSKTSVHIKLIDLELE